MASAKENNDLAFKQALHDLAAQITKRTSLEKKLKVFSSALASLGECGMAAGLPGTLDLCLALQAVLENTTGITGKDFTVLAQWPTAMMDYATAPEVAAHKNRLIEILQHPAWGDAISAEDAHVIRTMLDITLGAERSTGSTELTIEVPAVTATTPSPAPVAGVRNQQLPAEIRECLEIMLAELVPIVAQIKRAAEMQQGGVTEALQLLLDEIALALEFYSEAVASIDFKGLARVTAHARDNVRASAGHDQSAFADLLQVLDPWAESVQTYLQDPVEPASVTAMLALLHRREWLVPLTEAQLQEIQMFFAAQVFVDSKDSKPARQQQATAADVSIELPDDISRDLLEAMLQELPDQIEQLTTSIQRLQHGGTLEDIQIAKRIAHTLKGAGNTVGIRGIATLTHHLEDILLALYKHETLPPVRIMEVLTLATDSLAAMSEALLGMGAAPEDARQVLQDVMDLANQIDHNGLTDLMADTAGGKTTGLKSERPAEQAQSPDAVASIEPAAMVRIPAAFLDRLLRLAGETIITNRLIRNQLLAVHDQIRDTRQYFSDLRQFSHKIEEALDTKDLVRQPVHNGSTDFDALELDQYTELHTWVRQLVEKAVDIETASQQVRQQLHKLDETLLDQARMNEEIKDSVERNRLVQASLHFPRLQRSVRQAAKLTGKQVELQLEGGDTLIDGDVLNRLIDPLLHLLRNAVDHAIEPADQRLAADKPESGAIKLTFMTEGGDIRVICEDDGRGLDLQAIRAKAEALGLIKAGISVTDEQLTEFILRPDFSTRTETTQISGRGIGLDAVSTAITELSGSMAIRSVQGQGANFEIRLPASQMSAHAVLAGLGVRVVAIASRGIDQIVYHEQAEVVRRNENLVLKLDGQEYPARSLQSVLNTVTERRASARQPPVAVVFNLNSGKAVVLVDRIISCENVLIKTMGPYVPKIPGMLGVTVLGDGSVSPVMDMMELLRIPPGSIPTRPRTIVSAPHLPTALVVDDSLSARRALAQFMRDAGYEVRTARDGIEAFDLIRAQKPDILISDLEMPRMNGLELAGHVRANAALADLPIIMITSRSAVVHQQEAARAGINAYLTKPYSEDELLEHIHGIRATQQI